MVSSCCPSLFALLTDSVLGIRLVLLLIARILVTSAANHYTLVSMCQHSCQKRLI